MRIEGILEKSVIQSADRVLINTARLCETIKIAYRQSDPTRFIHLPNGFDKDQFDHLEGLDKYNRFTIAYTGSLYFGRSPEPVMGAIQQLLQQGKIRYEDISLKLVGHCQNIDGYPTSAVVHKYGLERVVVISPPVSFPDALKIVKKSHLALLLAPEQPFQVPAKAYDYLGIGTEILALAGEGATSDLITETCSGKVFSPLDIAGIRDFIHQRFTDQNTSVDDSRSLGKANLEIKHIVNILDNNLKAIQELIIK